MESASAVETLLAGTEPGREHLPASAACRPGARLLTAALTALRQWMTDNGVMPAQRIGHQAASATCPNGTQQLLQFKRRRARAAEMVTLELAAAFTEQGRPSGGGFRAFGDDQDAEAGRPKTS